MQRGVLTVKALLNRSARWYPTRPVLSDGERTLTYRDLNQRCRRIAHALSGLGVGKGDPVAFLSPSTIELVSAYHAAHKLGAVTVNLHARETVGHHARTLAKLGARLLVYDREFEPVADALASERIAGLGAVALGADGAPETLLGRATTADDREPDVDVVDDDPATILLSSGSTGTPKALLHTQRDVLTSAHGLMSSWDGIRPDDTFLNPFSPSFAVWLGHPSAFLNDGAHVVLLARWDPRDFLEMIQRYRVTCTALTPTMWKAVLALPVEEYDLKSLRLAYYVGEKMARDRIEEVMTRVTPHFGSLYGMAEFIGGTGFTMIRGEEFRAGKWTSIGRPMLNSDVRVVRAGGAPDDELEPGDVGEIVVRGATLAERSLTDPDWRATRVRDGWLFTRDLAYRDPDGYVHLLGRADYMINSGGVKFGPDEVEAVLEQHPAVAEAAVLGVPDDAWGQRVLSFVVARSPGLDADVLDNWCRGHEMLAPFKRPREYRFIAQLPRTPTGKLDRSQLPALLDP